MKRILTFVAMILMSFSLFAKSYYKEVISCLQKSDAKNALFYLKLWDMDKTKDDDPHYYICWFNYYFLDAQKNMKTIEVPFMTKKDSTQATVKKDVPSPDIMKKSISYMTKALEKFPDRLDFYSSRHFAMKATKFNEELKVSAVEMLKRAKENENKWTWEEGAYANGDIALESELGFVMEYLLNENDQTRSYMKEICDVCIEIFPDENFSYYYSGCYYFKKMEHTESYKYFEMAVKKNPEDYNSIYFLAVLAEASLKDKNKAIYWYEQALKSPEEKIQKVARFELKRLKSQ